MCNQMDSIREKGVIFMKRPDILEIRRRYRRLEHFFVDLLEDHPFEIGLSCALILFGTRSLVGGLSAAPGSVQTLPLILAFAYCFLSVVGGLGVLMGLGFRYRYTWAYGLERFGLFVSASAWFSYIIGLALTPITSRSTLLILALIALSIGCLLRARALNRNARATLVALRRARKDQEGS